MSDITNQSFGWSSVFWCIGGLARGRRVRILLYCRTVTPIHPRGQKNFQRSHTFQTKCRLKDGQHQEEDGEAGQRDCGGRGQDCTLRGAQGEIIQY